MNEFFKSVPGFICVLGMLAITTLRLLPAAGLQGPQPVMQVLISVVVLGSALYVILSKKYPDATQKWAFGAVGMIVGFWLPTA